MSGSSGQLIMSAKERCSLTDFSLVAEQTIAIVALLIGVFHVIKLEKVARVLPTHELQHFPYYVKEVSKLIERAKDEIKVATDFPCYCIFSSPELWEDYKHEIEKAVQKNVEGDKPSIAMKWLNPKQRELLLEEQFKPNIEDVTDNAWKTKSPEVEKRLKHFVKHYAPSDVATPMTAESVTYPQFKDLVESKHISMVSEFPSCRVQELENPLHIYFWIIDKEEAIFAIPNFEDRNQGRGYFTKDESIINGLLSVWERLR
jgi:hypothetical protein